jgi:hypothetical protein
MNETDDFMAGLVAGSGLSRPEALERYQAFLEREAYTAAMRAALERGGYDMGQVVGSNWDLSEQ